MQQVLASVLHLLMELYMDNMNNTWSPSLPQPRHIQWKSWGRVANKSWINYPYQNGSKESGVVPVDAATYPFSPLYIWHPQQRSRKEAENVGAVVPQTPFLWVNRPQAVWQQGLQLVQIKMIYTMLNFFKFMIQIKRKAKETKCSHIILIILKNLTIVYRLSSIIKKPKQL